MFPFLFCSLYIFFSACKVRIMWYLFCFMMHLSSRDEQAWHGTCLYYSQHAYSILHVHVPICKDMYFLTLNRSPMKYHQEIDWYLSLFFHPGKWSRNTVQDTKREQIKYLRETGEFGSQLNSCESLLWLLAFSLIHASFLQDTRPQHNPAESQWKLYRDYSFQPSEWLQSEETMIRVPAASGSHIHSPSCFLSGNG